MIASYKNQQPFYIQVINSEEGSRKKLIHYHLKIPRAEINLVEVKDFYNENFEIVKKETEEDTRIWKSTTYSDW